MAFPDLFSQPVPGGNARRMEGPSRRSHARVAAKAGLHGDDGLETLMNFEDLHAFYEVAQCGGFSQASNKMRIAQSALSRRVTRLEHHLGTALLVRYARGVRLTRDGEAMVQHAEDLIRQIKEIEFDIRGRTGEPSGALNVAFTPNSGQVLGPRLLRAAEKHPHVVLTLREGFSGAIYDWLLNGDVEVAFLNDPKPAPGLEFTPLVREPLYFVGETRRMRELGLATASLDLLERLPLILPGRGHSLRKLLEGVAKKNDLRLNVKCQIDGTRILKGVVEAGLGFTVFAYAALLEELQAGTISVIPFDPPIYWTFAMGWRTDLKAVSVADFVKATVLADIHHLHDGGMWRGKLLIRPDAQAISI